MSIVSWRAFGLQIERSACWRTLPPKRQSMMPSEPPNACPAGTAPTAGIALSDPESVEARGGRAIPARLLPTVAQLEGIKACCPLEVSSFSRALDGAGGDIWGARMIAEGRVMLYIADFAGHGSAVTPNAIHLHSLMETIPPT